MIVVDASAALAALLNDGRARHLIGTEHLHAPHLIDSEIASGLRRQVRRDQLNAADGWNALRTWRRLAVTRYPIHGLFERIWEIRENFSAYDATYVALAEALDCALVTADTRLSQASQAQCTITVVPR
ncbi:PIN domain-containing protein [Mycobacterium malmoense]|uniref:Ribonuclease VapC n=1 Tax=Mycobacterium malmoense TaxID=1780 RepID=A0ABX3SVH1_MYCMA|nr:type II toxin-antitoxin system VapC family toxin [Mycobacterium malmoense]OIN80788.1 VapC toxin family PIN domain ribonuclease [Mycobacterium malmoense]ORA84555.1 VapC toxin family PIN domain ribonuclease [Mycobacterium malmoense]QZA17219.1 PIN domain-containing protein [Mycobacterium malmoense]UNB94010.1 PIN domain-containing protein [Mycobacterium malmoense]